MIEFNMQVNFCPPGFGPSSLEDKKKAAPTDLGAVRCWQCSLLNSLMDNTFSNVKKKENAASHAVASAGNVQTGKRYLKDCNASSYKSKSCNFLERFH